MSKEAIVDLKEAIVAADTMIRVWRERGDAGYVRDKIDEQERAIEAAHAAIEHVQKDQVDSPRMVIKFERVIKKREKQLVAAEHATEIERLQHLAVSTKVLEKEITDLKDAREITVAAQGD